jgi:hypothetical protein
MSTVWQKTFSVEVILLCFKSLAVQKELMNEGSELFWM